MAGISDLPFRKILKSLGAGLTFSEMISAEAYSRRHKKTEMLIKRSKGETPFGIQLFGANSLTMSESARRLESETRCEIIDINLGCPAKKIMRGGSGAALMIDPERLFRVVDAVLGAVALPVTVKMRVGQIPEDRSGLKLIPELFARGVRAVSLHARSVACGFSRSPDWAWIKDAVAKGRPLIGNGGILSPEDALEMVRRTGCDAVMVARGYLGNPWIFREIRQLAGEGRIEPVALSERFDVMIAHLRSNVETFGEKHGVLKMRKHLAWYVRGLADSTRFRGRIMTLNGLKEVLAVIDAYREHLNQRDREGTRNG
jgi:nifR3 family TIM-barrel protein